MLVYIIHLSLSNASSSAPKNNFWHSLNERKHVSNSRCSWMQFTKWSCLFPLGKIWHQTVPWLCLNIFWKIIIWMIKCTSNLNNFSLLQTIRNDIQWKGFTIVVRNRPMEICLYIHYFFSPFKNVHLSTLDTHIMLVLFTFSNTCWGLS